MNNRHHRTLEAIFAHPISANIDFKDVESMLSDLGAEIDNRSKARIGVTLNGHTAAFHHAHHSLPKDEVVQIRHFLEKCGVSPDTVKR
jgi:hypothetical protein